MRLVDIGGGCAQAECPDAPTGHAAPGPGHGQITVEWTPATTGGTPTSWTVVAEVDGFQVGNESLNATARTHTFSNLDPTKDVTIFVSGYRTGGYSGDRAAARNVRALDANPPTFASATVDEAELTITFNEDLDTGSAPAGSAFSVSIMSPARTISGTGTAVISGATVTVTLASAVAHGAAVTLSYTKPDANPLQDLQGNEAANLSGEEVTNDTPPPGQVRLVDIGGGCDQAACPAAPTGYAYPGPGHGQITVDWEPAATGGTPTGWTVYARVDGVQTGNESLNASARTHTFSNLDPTKNVNIIVRGYATGGHSGDTAVARDVRPFADTTPPVFASATVDGTTLTVTFNKNLDNGSVPAPGDFNVTVGGARRNVASGGVAIDGATVTLTLASAVTSTDTVTLAYTQPSANPLQDAAENEVADFTGQEVANNTLPPGAVRLVDIGGGCTQAACPDAPTGYAVPGPGHGQITVNWEPATTGGAPTSLAGHH